MYGPTITEAKEKNRKFASQKFGINKQNIIYDCAFHRLLPIYFLMNHLHLYDVAGVCHRGGIGFNGSTSAVDGK